METLQGESLAQVPQLGRSAVWGPQTCLTGCDTLEWIRSTDGFIATQTLGSEARLEDLGHGDGGGWLSSLSLLLASTP